MFFSPVAVDVGIEFFFSGAHQANERLVAGVFMTSSPKDHFGQDGSEVNAFGGQRIDELAAVVRIALRGDDAVAFEAAQAVRQDVGGDLFVGVEKLVEGLVAAEHHVAKDEQGPAVAEHFDGGVERTHRAALRSGPLFQHFVTVAHFHLHGASRIGTLAGGNGAGRCSVKGSEADRQLIGRTL